MRNRHPVTAIIPYLRGTLTESERTRVADHLRNCEQCRRQADELRDTLEVMQRAVAQVPTTDPAIYRAQLWRKISARRPQAPSRSPWRPALIWGTALAAGFTALVLVFLPRGVTPDAAPNLEQLALAGADVDLLRNYQVVERMDLLENYDVIEHLDELKPANADASGVHSL